MCVVQSKGENICTFYSHLLHLNNRGVYKSNESQVFVSMLVLPNKSVEITVYSCKKSFHLHLKDSIL